jgi:transposase
VNALLGRVKEAGITDPLSLPSKELGSILYPPEKRPGTAIEPDLAYIDREMKRKGVTLFLLWEEYKLSHPSGFMYTQFCTRYREYRKKNQVYMRKIYKAGERMLVDWAGLTMQYTGEQGKSQEVYLFVAVLPASSILYTEPFQDMKIQAWIDAHVHAFEYFGGVPHLLVPDNTKTAVIKARYYDPELNRAYKEMGSHYGAVIIPARRREPTDKAPAETGVQIWVERRIIAKLRHRQFLSFRKIQEAVSSELEILNEQPFQKLPGSRRSAFLETEKAELMRLPARRYECALWKSAKVSFDYHVALDKTHYYSVPYAFAGKTVEIRATLHTVEVFCEGDRIACHVRSTDARRHYTTDPAHMPEKHRVMTEWTPERFISWAGKTGERTKAFITFLLGQREHPEQAYKTCAGILRMAQTVSVEQMEQASARALAEGVYSYACFQKLLGNRQKPETSIPHENVRGSVYYQGEDHV